ncbi:hypothetical protein GFS31_43040 (plasmid) [Leptolyngbya sp. BL0902]|nr:hypothetical protein GFS31_43040 [Leptolyngbya sp. BL0902]
MLTLFADGLTLFDNGLQTATVAQFICQWIWPNFGLHNSLVMG